MFGGSIGGSISFEMKVIFLICDVKNIIFGIVTFLINKHRNLCLKKNMLIFHIYLQLGGLLLFSFSLGFLCNSKTRIEYTTLNMPSLLCDGKANVLITEYRCIKNFFFFFCFSLLSSHKISEHCFLGKELENKVRSRYFS